MIKIFKYKYDFLALTYVYCIFCFLNYFHFYVDIVICNSEINVFSLSSFYITFQKKVFRFCLFHQFKEIIYGYWPNDL